MAQYIDKSAIDAEIEKIIANEIESIKSFEHSKNVSEVQQSNVRLGVLMYLRTFLDTLEVKEVNLDFENELYKAFGQVKDFTFGMCIARHFFELGIKAQKGEKQSFIDKACEWMRNNMYEGTCEQILSKKTYPFVEGFIDEFKQAMKGGEK